MKRIILALAIMATVTGCSAVQSEKASVVLAKAHTTYKTVKDKAACFLAIQSLKAYSTHVTKLTPAQEAVGNAAQFALVEDCSNVNARHTLDFLTQPFLSTGEANDVPR